MSWETEIENPADSRNRMISSLEMWDTRVAWCNLGWIYFSHEELIAPVLALMRLTEDDTLPDFRGKGESLIVPPHQRVLDDETRIWRLQVRFRVFDIMIGSTSPDWAQRCLSASSLIRGIGGIGG